MFIQSSKHKDYAVILHVNNYHDININLNLSGIEVKTSIYESIDRNKNSIVIKNNNTENGNIFKAFAATLYDNILEKSFDEDIEIIIKDTINDYQSYFAGTKKQLGELEQQGLFGELLFLKEKYLNKVENIVDYWEGIYKNKHDFVLSNTSYEIKTTRNQTRLTVHISNECQLDRKFVKELKLVVYRVEKITAGKTIYDLYKEILNLLPNNKKNLFKSKMIQAGFDENNVEYYLGFKAIEKYIFNVDDNFPKIDKNMCNDRIFEVKYHIDLDGIDSEKEVYLSE